MVELVCAREMPRPADVPRGPTAFSICGVQLPFIGTTYQLQGQVLRVVYDFHEKHRNTILSWHLVFFGEIRKQHMFPVRLLDHTFRNFRYSSQYMVNQGIR